MNINRKPTMRSLRVVSAAASALTWLAATVGSHAANYPATILSNNPTVYYRFEETSGTTAFDSSGNNWNASYNISGSGSPQLGLPGIDTNSILFNGGGADYGYVDIPNTTLIAPPGSEGTNSGAFSAELWVQPTAASSDWEVPIELAQYPIGWNIYVSGTGEGSTSYFYLDMRPPIFQGFPDFPIQFLQWYHLVLTYDGANATFYINGVSHGPYAAAAFQPSLPSDAHVGSGQGVGWQPFVGGIDEVAFYTNVLTASQVLTHYEVGTNSFRPVVEPPSIIADPESVTNYSGLSVSFSVTASGTTPLHYLWFKNGVHVGPDATPYTFTCQYPADKNASIYVIVTNSINSATSTVATLTVQTNVNIVGAPGSITRNVGSHAAFHVIANGAVPISYQWSNSVDGAHFTAIPGATSPTLWLTNVQLTLNGEYYAVNVSNPFTSASAVANLAVQTRPVVVPLTGYAQIIAADDPVAYWRLDETNGSTTAVDAVGTFNGTYTTPPGTFTYQVPTGIPHWTNDPAVDMEGGANIIIPFAPELNPDTAWSAETWFKPSSLGANGGDYRVIFSSEYNVYPNPYNGWYVYQQPSDTIAFVPQPGNGFIVAGPPDPANNNLLVANHWYHMVVSDDLVNFNVYLNGQLRASFPVSGIAFVPNGCGINLDGSPGITPGFGPSVLGQRADDAFNAFMGTLDETAFYNYALSPSQVAAHYAGTVTITITQTSPTSVSVSWPTGILQSAPSVTGPWTDVPGSPTSPYPHTSTGAAVYYQVRLPNP